MSAPIFLIEALDVILPATISALATIVAAVIPLLGVKVSRWLESKAHLASFECANKRIMEMTRTAVLEVEQTLVKEYKKASADGKITKEEGIAARDSAYEKVKKHLGKDGWKELLGCLKIDGEALRGLLISHIEARVSENKK